MTVWRISVSKLFCRETSSKQRLTPTQSCGWTHQRETSTTRGNKKLNDIHENIQTESQGAAAGSARAACEECSRAYSLKTRAFRLAPPRTLMINNKRTIGDRSAALGVNSAGQELRRKSPFINPARVFSFTKQTEPQTLARTATDV